MINAGRLCWTLCLLLACTGAVSPLSAQLRPVEPIDLGAFDRAARERRIGIGFAAYSDQRASFAGTEGTLIEVGMLSGSWRTGRVVIEAGGTMRWAFSDDSRYAPPHETVDEAGPDRGDVGDFRITTAVRLTPDRWRTVAFARFGTRLPTTDDRIGLERDRTDFIGTVGVQVPVAGWLAGGEVGVGIHGTHHPKLEQSDVVIYHGAIERRVGPIVVMGGALGHFDGMEGAIRGNEELGEVRVGVRTMGDVAARVEFVAGYMEHSPGRGMRIAISYAW